MATYTTIPAFTSGQVLTSSVMNDVKNNLDLGNAQSAYPYRNLIYNGAMQVHQRGTSTASITASNYYTADRWSTALITLGTWTQSVENDAPTGSGFRKSLRMLCTTADASPAAGDVLGIDHVLEGQDLQRIAKGTASAQSLVMTFWVKANVTGTYIVSLYDNDNTRHVCKSYTISASGTWEKKEVSFPADTSGLFDNDNAASLYVRFYLAAGSNRTSGTLATTWASFTQANDAVGQVNLASAINNSWQVTGVQLETGSVSTPFEFLPYGDELARCQRYYYMHANGATASDSVICNACAFSATDARGTVHFPVTMRSVPDVSAASGTGIYSFARNSGDDIFNSVTRISGGLNSAVLFNNSEISSTAGDAGYFRLNSAGAYVAFTAEL